MVTAWRSAVEAYKKTKQEQRELSRLVSKDLDYRMLQKLLNSLADNQNKIKIIIKLSDGTRLEMVRQEKAAAPMRDPYQEVIE